MIGSTLDCFIEILEVNNYIFINYYLLPLSYIKMTLSPFYLGPHKSDSI